MSDGLEFTISDDSVPGPGEIIEVEENGCLLLVENTHPPREAGESSDEAGLLDAAGKGHSCPGPHTDHIVKYVPVETTARQSVVRHAAPVYQRPKSTRVDRWPLCDRSGTREVERRLDREPLTNVTCTQCRNALIGEGVLA